jgi:hypothetical protein
MKWKTYRKRKSPNISVSLKNNSNYKLHDVLIIDKMYYIELLEKGARDFFFDGIYVQYRIGVLGIRLYRVLVPCVIRRYPIKRNKKNRDTAKK